MWRWTWSVWGWRQWNSVGWHRSFDRGWIDWCQRHLVGRWPRYRGQGSPTGSKPLFTHWVHGEYMVGSETKYPAWTHRVHFDYFLITFTIRTQFAHPNTHQVHVEYFYKVPTQIATDHQVGYIQKIPTKNPVGKCWSNYKQNP